jgi:hypothetical protein
MTQQDQERLVWLCTRIQQEKDRDKFTALVAELNELLQREEKLLTGPPRPKPAAESGVPSPRQRRN